MKNGKRAIIAESGGDLANQCPPNFYQFTAARAVS
jgi:hypothetical protein